jgi:FixJ family two-component response regulator
MNRYKYTPAINLSTRLTKKLSVNTTRFFNLLNSGLTSGLVATKTGVSTRTIQRLRKQLVSKITTTTDYTNWTY